MTLPSHYFELVKLAFVTQVLNHISTTKTVTHITKGGFDPTHLIYILMESSKCGDVRTSVNSTKAEMSGQV